MTTTAGTSAKPTATTSSSLFGLDRSEHLCIPIQSASVRFLQTPEQFYHELLARISSSSRRRIVLAALYLGTGEKEQQIVAKLDAAISANPGLEVGILLDYFRGTRGGPNSSAELLKTLTAKPNVQVSLFHTPEMRGLIKSLLPERVNEVIGLQHMKFFIFDDSIIISGANLSDQYFVNRQDRYMLVENSPVLADFFHAVFSIISRHSLHLNPEGQLTFNGDASIHPLTGSNSEIQKCVQASIDQLYQEFKRRLSEEKIANNQQKEQQTSTAANDTFMIPFLQMGCFQIDHETQLFSKLFNNNEGEDLELTLMTAYFNLYDAYADLILRKSHFPLTIVFGSPRVVVIHTNGFFGAAGPSGQVPALYVQNALDFMGRVVESGRREEAEIVFREWDRPNWTFHAKGIWIDSRRKPKQMMGTLVGSSNYGYRSAHRDLEAQVLLVTWNEALKRKIAEERSSLLEYAETVDVNAFLRRDHLIPSWVKYFSRFFRNFF